MRIVPTVAFAFSILLSAHVSAGFTYPTKPVLSFGAENVEKDLLQVYQSESANAKPATLQKRNKSLLSEMKTISEVGRPLTKKQAQSVLDLARSHPIVSAEGSKKYDTRMEQIGYCFGQAVFVHLELLRRGADPKSIGKLWAIGPLMQGKRPWDFHVTTLARSQDGWWAIDGLHAEVQSLEEWTKRVLSWAQEKKNPNIRFYFSDAIKLNPTPGAYSEKKLFEPHYKGFFKDLAAWFEKNSVGSEDKFQP